MMRPDETVSAARAVVSDVAVAITSLTNINGEDSRFDRREAEEALRYLLPAVQLAMEIAGFDPDETERGQLYRAIVDYIGEDSPPRSPGGADHPNQPRRLGDASTGGPDA